MCTGIRKHQPFSCVRLLKLTGQKDGISPGQYGSRLTPSWFWTSITCQLPDCVFTLCGWWNLNNVRETIPRFSSLKTPLLLIFFFRNSNSRWWEAHLATTSSNNKAWWDLRCPTMTLQGCFWTCGFPRVPDNVHSTRFSACLCWLLPEFHNKAQQHRGFMMMFCCPNRDPHPPNKQYYLLLYRESFVCVCIMHVAKLSICCYLLKSPYVENKVAYLCNHPGGSEYRMIKVSVKTLCSVIRVVLIICKAQSLPSLMNITNCGCRFSCYAVAFCFGR